MVQLRILFVDDSDLDVMLAVRALRGAGREVVYRRVDQAADMARELQSGAWEIVLCDHKMPAFDALSALRLHRRLNSALPFVIVSGVMPDELAIEAMREGARDFLNKNNLSRLLPTIERELHDARGRALLQQTQASIDRLLFADQLTGVGNQDALVRRLGEVLGQNEAAAFLLIDLDRFSRLAQSLGLVAANRILRVVAMRISAAVDTSKSFVARIGTDRFGVVIPGPASPADLENLARQLQSTIHLPIPFDGQAFSVSAGIGAVRFPEDAALVEDALLAAESALDAAKREGAGSYLMFVPGMGAQARQEFILEHALRQATERGEFVLHYQPLVAMATGRPIGVEALLRWQRPERGLVLPGTFVPLLEDSGLIIPVGDWVLRAALAQLNLWRSAGLCELRLSVNLSAAQLRQADFVSTVQGLLAESGVPPDRVELEITESVAMGNEEQTIAVLSGLKALGVSLALDDFGTGYSSLAYLQYFPLDRLKIDQSFVRGELAGGNQGIVKAVVAISQSMNLATTAEGVETADQADQLRASGCLHAQGFHYARPMSADEATAYLKRWA